MTGPDFVETASTGSATPTGSAAPTGQPAVDAALARLADVDDLPPSEWVAVYEAVHRSLRETLATIDEG